MKPFLPSATQPWAEEIVRRHTPNPGSYDKYKPCLRWEFGFSCAFCLLHEVDLMIGGTFGWTIMQIEHAVAQSQDASKANDYNNCFHICERCNKLRGALPNQDEQGNRLLEPCADRWSEHFECVEDEILPREGDGSARYTLDSYGLNDPEKVTHRAHRRHWMEKYADSLVEFEELEKRLHDQIVIQENESKEAKLEKLETANMLWKIRDPYREKLAEYSPIPRNHDRSCRCGSTIHHTIPKVLADQTVDLADLLREARERRSRRSQVASSEAP